MFGLKPNRQIAKSSVKMLSFLVPLLIFGGALFTLVRFTGVTHIEPVNATLLTTFFASVIGFALGGLLYGQWVLLEKLDSIQTKQQELNGNAEVSHSGFARYSRQEHDQGENGTVSESYQESDRKEDSSEEQQAEEKATSSRFDAQTRQNRTTMETMVKSIETYVDLDMLQLARKKLKRLESQFGEEAPVERLEKMIQDQESSTT